MNTLDQQRIVALAAKLKDPRALMGSIWGKSEIEVMAWQTIRGCASNLSECGEAFSYDEVVGNGRFAENESSLDEMLDLGLLARGTHGGRKTLIPTALLLDELERQLGPKSRR